MLHSLEFHYSKVKYYRRKVDDLIDKNTPLFDNRIVIINKKLNYHINRIDKLKYKYEDATGKRLVFFQSTTYGKVAFPKVEKEEDK